MALHGRFGRLVCLAALVVACGSVRAAEAQTRPARFLAKEDIILYGIGLKVEPAQQTVPKDVATIVSTYLQAPALPDGLPPFAPDAEVRATLAGPSFSTPRELVVSPNQPFNIPPLTVPGIHTLENIRLVSGGEVLLYGAPQSVRIEVIERLLVTQVTARPLSAAEIREKGIVFDRSNFLAYNFSVAFAIEDKKINLNFPVLLPALQGADDEANDQVRLSTIPEPQLPTLKTIIPDTLRIQTQVPNLTVVGFTLKAPQLEGQQLIVPPIPGVIVIPGDIGFLNQFFSVMLMVGNVAPTGSNLVVDNVKAEIVLPPGRDGVVGSGDDPLRMANTANGQSPKVQVVVQPGLDAKLGTGDDVATIGPGETGNAEYLVEGRREGSHVVEMAITATLHGLPVGPVPITGRAAGAVLVRNPKFTLTFTHPEIVTAGEAYTLDVTITNTSEAPANFVSLNLYPRNISGATIVGESTQQVESIPPGDSATVTFDLISRITGKVFAATLDSDENVAGRFALKTSVGELGVPLSPDSLVLPAEANSLPKPLRNAAIGLLGKAWAVATAPAAALPKDLSRFSKKIVLDRAVEVAEAGFRVTLREPLADSAAQLAMEFTGSNYSRLGDLVKPADLMFEQSNFRGFDELRRKSIRGDVFATAVANVLLPSLESSGASEFHANLAERWSYRPAHVSILSSSISGAAPYDLIVIDAAGKQLGGVVNGKVNKEIAFADLLRFTNSGGALSSELAILAAPQPGALTVRLVRRAAVADAPMTLSLVLPKSGGGHEQVVYSINPGQKPATIAGGPYPVAFEIADATATVARTSTTDVQDPAPTVVSVIQQKDADQIRCEPEKPGFAAGRIVAVLFSEEVTPASVQDRLAAIDIANYAPEANRVVGVALQPGRRIAFLALRDPLGPFISRSITISNIADLKGHAMGPWTGPMEATVNNDGAVVTGRVLDASGAPIPFADVRLFYRIECNVEPTWVGISAKNADESGRYSWDYVAKPLLNRILAVDTQNDEFRNVQYNVQRQGQRLNVDIVFLGRGSIHGVVRSEDGALLRDAHVKVTSLTDRSQYGVRTDSAGRYSIARVPVGNVFIEAVHTGVNARVAQADFIAFAGAVVERDLTLLDIEQTHIEIKHGTVRGHVYRADGVTPADGLPVFAYYYSGSQQGVNCPPGADPCPIATTITSATGEFEFEDLTAGRLQVRSFDQSGLSSAEVGVVLGENQTVSANLLLSGGLGTVQGTVIDADQNPVAGAQVGGGLSLATTNAQGEFTLADVPVGRREIVAVSQARQSSGRVIVDIIREGDTVPVTIVLDSRGVIAGKVTEANGTTPVVGVTVYAFRKSKMGGGYDIVGSAQTGANGGYTIPNVPIDAFKVSAFSSGFVDGNIADAVVKFNGQTVKAAIKFRGANGKVTGVVYNSVGNTPLKARVGVSGDRVRIAGGLVGVAFERVENFKIVDTNLADGKFTINGLFVGPFTLNAAGAFSPDPISVEGEVHSPGETVQMDLALQATSEIKGTVTDFDGVTPMPAGVIVHYKSEEYKVVCTENSIGETTCVSIPQGIQEENVVTDDAGRFWFPLVNAGMFTLSIEDPQTGKVAQVRGSVRPGQVAEVPVRLLAQGAVRVEVLGSDTTTKIGGAKVIVKQPGYPRLSRELVADSQGVALFAGGDSLTEGEFTVEATDMGNGFAGRATGRITSAGGQVTVRIYIGNATGTVAGVVYDQDGVAVPNADVIIGNNLGPLAFSVSGPDGSYSLSLVPLGPFTVDVFDAKTGRRALGSGEIFFGNQTVPVNLTLLSMGLVKGIVLENGPRTPLKDWSVTLSQRSASGVTLPTLTTTTGVDGRFTIPGAGRGTFTLRASKKNVNGIGQATGALDREGQVVDVSMVVTIERPLSGTIVGTVLTSTGAPAKDSIVEICAGCGDMPLVVTADEDGNFTLANVPLGRFTVRARSQTTKDAGTTVGELRTDGEIASVVVAMEGVAQVSGVVEFANGGVAAGAQVVFEGFPTSACGKLGCTSGTDSEGRFSFADQPARSFTITATSPLGDLKGTVGGPLAAGENRTNLRIVLAPTTTVTGRVVTSGAQAAVGVIVELIFREGAGDERRLYKETGADGSFMFPAVPLEPYRLVVADPVGEGLASRSGQITGPLSLGNIVLDEASPAVASLTPQPSATGVPTNQAITIVFTEPIQPGSVNVENVSLTGPSGAVLATRDVTVNDTTVVVTPLAPLATETRYTLRITNVKDRVGKSIASDYIAAFTTVDKTPPAIPSTSPEANIGGVSIYAPIRIQFSEPVVALQPAASALTLTGPLGPVAGEVEYLFGNAVLVFTPALPLAENANYTVNIATTSDIAGNDRAASSYQFATTDRTPPVIAALVAANGGQVIENGATSVAAQVNDSEGVVFVDFYLNGQLAFVDRAKPFAIDFQATPQLGAPGSTIEVSAVATDFSGNRSVAPISTTVAVVADQPPAVVITQPAGNISAENGQHIVVKVRGTDDLGVRTIGYRALTGKPGDALAETLTTPVRDHEEEFAFNVPLDAEPGIDIAIEASAADTKGQVSVATPVHVTVVDSVNPEVHITGATTGGQLVPGTETTVVVTAEDKGGITKITFDATGVTTSHQERTLDGTQKAAVTSFTVSVPSVVQPGQKLLLNAKATDRTGNEGDAASLVLVVEDSKAPSVTLAPESGVATAVPGRPVTVIASASDESELDSISLTATGAVSFSDAKQVPGFDNSASLPFEIPVPSTAVPGTTINVSATARDTAGNVSTPATLVLTIVSPVNVTLPASELLDAGQTRDITVQLGAPAPAGGLTLTFASSDTNVATAPLSLVFAEDETLRTLTITGVAGGSAQLSALVGGVERATMTVTVSGGIVTGVVRDSRLVPVGGANVTVTDGGTSQATVTDSGGNYRVAGVPGPSIDVRVTDPVTKLYGHAKKTMTHTNGVASVNVVLIPAGAITGTVFEVNGTDAAGAGVRVEIFVAGSITPLATTFTVEGGAYEFPLVTLGEYVITATNQGKRARGTASLTQSGQVLDVPLVYLGTGTVSGTVFDGAKQPVGNAKLTFETETVFGERNKIVTNANGNGTFSFLDAPIGTWTVKAEDPGTGQGGSVSGKVTHAGEDVPADVFLASFGAIEGHVFRADGETIAAGVNVQLGNNGQRTVTDSEGKYRFDVVKLGTHTISAEDPGTLGKGSAVATIAAHQQLVTADITLLAQGRLLVTVRDAGGQLVPSAAVKVEAPNGTLNTTTGENGTALVEHVQAGPFKVTATFGTLSGKVEGSLVAGALLPVDVQLEGTGTITGVVMLPNGTTPATSGYVLFYQSQTRAELGANGSFRFDGVKMGNYRLDVYDSQDRRRALTPETDRIVLSQNGQVETRELRMLGLGTVTGRVVRSSGASAEGVSVTVRSGAGLFARSVTTTTNAGGLYTAESMPEGPVSVTASKSNQQLYGVGSGTIAEDGETETVDIVLTSNVIALPADRDDANNFRFYLQADGRVTASTNDVYGGGGGANSDAFILDIVSLGAASTFTGGEIPTGEEDSREIVVRQENVAGLGLSVTRKAYVPRGGYFARYLEILRNPGAAPITIDVRVRSHIRGDSAGVSVRATSSGDADVSVSGERDRWVTVRKIGTAAAQGFLFDGPGVDEDRNATAATFVNDTSVSTAKFGRVLVEWQNITIPPGGTVAFMHFGVQQLSPAGAQAAVERLAGLPPEALVGLSGDELQAIRNFAMPLDGSSSIDPLPSLLGTVSGEVLEGANLARVPGANVHFTSAHPLFGRTHTVKASGSGTFVFEGVIGNSNNALAIPVHAFTLSGTHPLTSITAPSVSASFPVGSAAASANVVFADAGQITGVVRRHSLTAVPAGDVTLTGTGLVSKTVSIAGDGSYRFTGIPAGDYVVSALVDDSSAHTGLTGSASVTVIDGQVATADITIEGTGTVTGVVRTAGGAVAPNVTVKLTRPDGFTHSVSTSTAGVFTFADVPLGNFTLTAIEPGSGVVTSVTITVSQDETTTQDLSLIAAGIVTGTVTDTAGIVTGVTVTLRSHNPLRSSSFTAVTNGSGVYRITGVPAGSFTVSVDNATRFGEAAGEIVTDGQEVVVDLKLVNNPVDFPELRFDANNFRVNTQANGSNLDGTNSVFSSGTTKGASVLEFAVGGGALAPFMGLTTGWQEDDNREVATWQNLTDKVRLTRKVSVPRFGYFTRYLEKLENIDTVNAVSIRLRLVSNVGRSGAAGTPTIISTSSDDAVLAAGVDRWVVLDDAADGILDGNSSNSPAVAFVFDGGTATQVGSATWDPTSRQLAYEWNVSVPAGGSVTLMHSVVQQVSRAGAIASAQRLVQLPPEVLDGLAGSELASLRNFNVPPGGTSTLAPLPRLNGRVVGRVLAGDSVTPMKSSTTLTFRSDHPLFGRAISISVSSTDASFDKSAVFNDVGSTAAIPLYPFTLTANYSTTATSYVYHGDFDGTYSGNLSQVATASASSVVNGVPVSRLIDGRLDLAWRANTGDAANLGKSPWAEVGFAQPVFVTQVNIRGNRTTTQVITSARLDLMNSAGVVLYTQSVALPGPAFDADVVIPGGVADVRRVRLTSLADLSSTPGFAEVEAIGDGPAALGLVRADVAMLNTGVLRGFLKRHTGAVVPGQVNLVRSNPNLNRTLTVNADGKFEQVGLVPGTYTLNATQFFSGFGTALTSSTTIEVPAATETVRDAVLPATGGITGLVTNGKGQPVAGVEMQVGTTLGFHRTGKTNAQGRYLLNDILPGTYSLSAEEPRSDVVSTAPVTIVADAFADRDMTVPAIGAVEIELRYASGQPATGLTVFLKEAARTNIRNASVNADTKVAAFANVTEGDWVATARHPKNTTDLIATLNGRLENEGELRRVVMTLPAAGSVEVEVKYGSGDPAASVSVTLEANGMTTKTSGTGTNGKVLFSGVPAGQFTVTVKHPRNSKLVSTFTGTLTNEDEIARPVIELPAIATVRGTVYMPDGTPAPGAAWWLAVNLASTNPAFTATSVNLTQGVYQVSNVPVGPFTVNVFDTSLKVTGKASGEVRQIDDGKVVSLDLHLQPLAPLPTYLYDANAFPYDIQRSGTIGAGIHDVFGGAARGAERLELLLNGAPVPFTGSSDYAVAEDGDRELDVTQADVAGVDVTRKVFVPADGYFARYLDILRNPGTTPVTVDVRLSSFARGVKFDDTCNCTLDAPLDVVTTSSGDQMFAVGSDDADRWLVLDDEADADPFLGDSVPAVGFIFDGDGAADHTASGSIENTTDEPHVRYAWENVTIPPGGSVAYLHFVVQQTSRAAAVASMERLAQVPPEAIAGLSAEESASIRNFAVPDGSSVEPLPTVLGTVTGRVLASDEQTVVPGANVSFRSSHPLFGRTVFSGADETGSFTFTGAIDGSNTIAIPAAPFTLKAFDSGIRAETAGTFAAGQTTSTANVVFSTAATVLGTVRRAGGAPVPGVNVELRAANLSSQLLATTGEDGSFRITQVMPGDYLAVATTLSGRQASAQVTIGTGVVTIADLVLPAIGSIVVQTDRANGAPLEAATVERLDHGSWIWVGVTDLNGQLRVDDLLQGTHQFRAYNPNDWSMIASGSATVATDAEVVTLPLVFAAFGTVTGTVRTARGTDAFSMSVVLENVNTGERRSTWLGNSSQFTFLGIPAGQPWRAMAVPENGDFVLASVSEPFTLIADDETHHVDLVLAAQATVRVLAQDSTGQPMSTIWVEWMDAAHPYFQSAGYTNSLGVIDLRRVPAGEFTVRLRDGYAGTLVAEHTGTIVSSDDGATVPLTITVAMLRGTVTGTIRTAASGSPVAGGFVQLVNPIDGTVMRTMTTLADGTYRFNDFLAGSQGFTIRAVAPHNANVVVELSAMFATAGEVVTLDLALPVTGGRISGVVHAADGTTLVSNATVIAYEADGNSGGAIAYTGTDGKYALENVSFSGPITIEASIGGVRQSEVRTFTVQGDDLTVDFTLPVFRGGIEGYVFGGDGVTAVPNAEVEIVSGDIVIGWTRTDDAGHYSLPEIYGAAFTVVARYWLSETSVDASAQREFTAPSQVLTQDLVLLPLSVVRGRVTFGDGAPVAGAQVFVEMSDLRTRWVTALSDGRYALFGAPLGPIRVTAQDSPSGLTKSVNGTLTDPAVAAVGDVSLPATGIVVGRLRNGSTPLVETWVRLNTENLRSERWNQTSDQGEVRFEAVPEGQLTLYAEIWDEASGRTIRYAGSGAVVANATTTIDLAVFATGTVTGRVLATDGTPVAGANVQADVFVSGEHVSESADTNQNGVYTIVGVPAGQVYLTAWAPDGTIAKGEAVLASSATVTADLMLGTGTDLEHTLSGSDGFKYDISAGGEIIRGGKTDGSVPQPYGWSYSLEVTGDYFCCAWVGALRASGQELALGPLWEDSLAVTRNVYVPPSGGFARYLEVLYNPTSIPRTTTVYVSGYPASGTHTRWVVSPTATSRRYAVSDDSFIGVPERPALGWVMAGAGTVAAPVSGVEFRGDGNNRFAFQYTVTVPPGQTVAVMHFTLQRDPADAAGAKPAAEALVNLTDPNALAGLTAAEKAMIVNFNIPQ